MSRVFLKVRVVFFYYSDGKTTAISEEVMSQLLEEAIQFETEGKKNDEGRLDTTYRVLGLLTHKKMVISVQQCIKVIFVDEH